MVWVRALAVWLVIIAAETVHGILRTLLLQPLVGDFRARQIAVGTGALLICVIVILLTPWLRASSTSLRLRIGVAWVVLTLLFEIALGRLVLGLSWDRLLSDYDVSRGGLLIFGLLVLLFAPSIAHRARMAFARGEQPGNTRRG